MVEATGWAGALLLPPILATLAFSAAAFDAVLAARAAGSTASRSAALDVPRTVAGLLVQQRRRTRAADTLLWRAAGIALLSAAVLASLVTPLGRWAVGDLSVGVVWFNAMEVVAWAAVWLAGWGANSAPALVGGYRFLAQGLAYELPHMFALTTAALGAGSLRVADIVGAQQNLWFVVWMPVAFVVFLVSVLAMAFFRPFDHPLGRDTSGGVLAELSGVDRLVFVSGRWLLLVSGAAMSVPLFLGGGQGPVLPGWLWTLVKTVAVLAVLVFVGRRVPTIRMDRFEELSWLVLVPLTLAQALAVAVVVLVEGG
ncbi:NADH-quinone oxidoreductase subunit H [Saccharomonospora amisosensis]|uniref:NADH-quinone oxidoreductase subunit H n=1 Tax=Saccharomonospora amisosensis TaxID=1128677 RepID=A0A7X5UNS0_9PSEU|nr:complex I subunit 1 family protein [Saccharomonospora amisosensis]NIJ11385.1 NADH-quinone oxidoreductase subunit H [Saccharomonospora amisosensis]